MIRKGRLATRDTRRERREGKTARGVGEKQESTQSVTQIYIYIKTEPDKERSGTRRSCINRRSSLG